MNMKRTIIVIITAIMLLVISVLLLTNNKGIKNIIGWYMVNTSNGFPSSDWFTSTPEEEGIDSNGLIEGYQYIADNKVNAHSLLIIRNGKIADETYFYPYQKDDMINIHSCTKSIISALVGIAIEEGYIKNVDQKVLDFFTDRKIKNMSPEKQNITIRDLLTMSAGLEAAHPDNDMKSSEDWVQFILDKKMSDKPGTKFNYCDSTPHLLSAILQKATGMSTYEFANTRLFIPMGIKALWPADPQGVYYGFSEINMTPRDMAKFGYLYLNKGKWDGKQLIPEDWVKKSTKPQIKTGWGNDYGYLWWCPPLGFQASGLGEQIIEVIPQFNSVIVSTNGLDDEQHFNLDPFHRAIKHGKLPDNTKDYNELEKLKQQVALLRDVKPVKSAPETVMKISGKQYIFPEVNPLNLKDLTVDFSQEKYIVAKVNTYAGVQDEVRIPIDGSYFKDTSRKSKNDTVFMTGYWQDAETFAVVYEKSFKEIICFTFKNDKVIVKAIAGGKMEFDGLTGNQVK